MGLAFASAFSELLESRVPRRGRSPDTRWKTATRSDRLVVSRSRQGARKFPGLVLYRVSEAKPS